MEGMMMSGYRKEALSGPKKRARLPWDEEVKVARNLKKRLSVEWIQIVLPFSLLENYLAMAVSIAGAAAQAASQPGRET